MQKAQDEQEQQPQAAHHQQRVLVLRDKAAQLLGDGPAALLRCGGGGLGRLARGLGRAGPCPVGGGVLLLQALLLPQAGDGGCWKQAGGSP